MVRLNDILAIIVVEDSAVSEASSLLVNVVQVTKALGMVFQSWQTNDIIGMSLSLSPSPVLLHDLLPELFPAHFGAASEHGECSARR